MKRYLVTGGAGFIGSHIVDTLVKDGHFVRVLDNFSSGKSHNLKDVKSKIDLIRGDIRNPNTCLKATKGMDFILHQAALRSVPKSFLNTGEYNDININGTLNLLKAAVKNKVKVFVFASSSSVYGDVRHFPEKEDFSLQPISPYALTKLAGEHYCRIFSSNYGLATVCLRYFNVFGPRQSLDDEYAGVIPKFISYLLNNRPPPIYGTGRQSRDFTYVDNVVSANILATKLQNAKGEIFNIGCGRPRTILSLAAALNKIMRKNIKPIFLPPRPGDVFKTQADITKVKKILGFQPKTDFNKGLKLTVEWFLECAKE
ncbi:MAG: SDR family oxidoreductase [Candidatus Omnitrophica bacterium]|nr:SDR family oxidoreductase [Candidatus Omnitrophota bacterium]